MRASSYYKCLFCGYTNKAIKFKLKMNLLSSANTDTTGNIISVHCPRCDSPEIRNVLDNSIPTINIEKNV